ncbi:MAG TPA: DUF126 domain-containing protein [Vicinamibacterales bacterium]|nr:DUF126 domain-containing protein [Vicinamibacterales bacterium]
MARAYAAGEADGTALVLAEPLSFWGGIEARTGRIIDHSHPDRGEIVTGRILVMRSGRGSSSASSVLAETIRRGTGPAGIVLAIADPILTVGSLVAHQLYGLRCPLVVCPIDDIRTGDALSITATDTTASVTRR